MKVKELIAALQEYDEDMEVFTRDYDGLAGYYEYDDEISLWTEKLIEGRKGYYLEDERGNIALVLN